MKVIVIPVINLFLFVSFLASAQKPDSTVHKIPAIKWHKFEEALALNNNYPKKKLFVDVYTDWCGWCKKMDAGTFKDSAIAAYMNENFYAIKFDAERKDTIILNGVKYVNTNPNEKRGVHQIAANLLQGKLSYPSYVFLSEVGSLITVAAGYKSVEDMESLLHYYGDNQYIYMPYSEYREKFPKRK